MAHPYILGLTGSVGMGKSTTANMFKKRGISVLDSDSIVHQLYAPGGSAVPIIQEAFPGVVVDSAVDRQLLSKQVIGNPEALENLEAIVLPLVHMKQKCFLQDAAERSERLVVLDIPLLFETRAEDRCDAVAVVSAPLQMQRERVMARPGMNEEKFDALLKRQMPDEEKRKRATFVINTGVTLEETEKQVNDLVDLLRSREGEAYARMLAKKT